MSTTEAKRTHKAEDVRRREILETAARLFAANGYRATEVQAIADEVNVGKGTVYRLFPTKEALFLAAVEHVMVRLTESIEQTVTPHEGDPLKQITVSTRAYLEFFDRHPDFAELFIQERAEFRERAKPVYFTYRKAHLEKWREVWRSAMRQGVIRAMPVDTALNFMSDLLFGVVMTNRIDPRGITLSGQVDGILGIVLQGIRPQTVRQGESSDERIE